MGTDPITVKKGSHKGGPYIFNVAALESHKALPTFKRRRGN
jgi:hypothetical protein